MKSTNIQPAANINLKRFIAMKKLLIYKMGIVLLLVGGVISCNDLSLAPSNEFTEENYWTSPDKAEMVLNTAYSQMSNATYFFYNAALSDNAYMGRGDAASISTIAQGNHNPSTNRFNNQWDMHYSGIKTTHVFLENIDNVSDMDESLKARMKAEARFIRAWHYFRLTNWFGDVPHFTEDISVERSQNIESTSHEDIIAFIHEELNSIQSDLPVRGEYGQADQGRITKGAAIALNARVALYENDWEGVVDNTEKLIGTTENGNYGLFSSYRGVFLPQNEYNQEVIFDFQYVENDVTHNIMFDLAPLTAGARVNAMAPTQELVDAYPMENGLPIEDPNSGYDENNPYDNRDPRLDATIVRHMSEWENDDGTTRNIYIEPNTAPDEDAAADEYKGQGSNATSTGYYLRKYYDPSAPANFNSGLNLIVIRYADVLLMHAEAKNELGQMNQQVWDNTIRRLRNRAGLDQSALAYDGSWSQEELRQLIRNERRVELGMEGLRIHDLRRWETAEDVLNGPVHGAAYGSPTDEIGMILTERTFNPSRDYWWPIPQAELDLNDNLEQNPGY